VAALNAQAIVDMKGTWSTTGQAVVQNGRAHHPASGPGQGTAWDIAYGAVYLASDESRRVTGVLPPIDGGLTALRAWPR
jgi:NAD(P)-dependent dehydrogenase (short-subunit alcohol dehydrogenase family)